MKLHAPAADRNKEPILGVLRTLLPSEGLVLEIASGTGQHTVHFAAAFPGVTFAPSDPSPEARASIDAWARESGLGNIEPARDLDVCVPGWERPAVAVVCINMIHIAPWAAALALIDGASRCLASGSPLVLYGPYRFHGEYLADSNAAFDQSLRMRDPSWGVRDIDDIDAATADHFERGACVAMPANNHVLVYRRR